jgi:hypothetical protein
LPRLCALRLNTSSINSYIVWLLNRPAGALVVERGYEH